MKLSRNQWVLAVAAVGVAGVVVSLGLKGNNRTEQITATVERGDIRDVVEATGTVNAVITVQVGSQVSGTIARLYADFNSRVHKGQVVAEIDPSVLQQTLLQANADLEAAKANVEAAQAGLEKAQASLVQMKAEYDRTAELSKEQVSTQQEVDVAKANFTAAQASVDAAAAAVSQARAQVSQRTAAVSIAQANLGHTVIHSPIDGVVVARNVDVGQTVAASLSAPTIFTIAQDLTKMQVYVKVDESDVGVIKVGKPVSFRVDAFPKDVFHGTVSQIRMNAAIVQNVVTYDAIIDFANPDLKLFPGMTAYVTMPVATALDALKLPNAALRYRPPMDEDAVVAAYRKAGIDVAGSGTGEAGGARGGRSREAAGGGRGAAAAASEGNATPSSHGGRGETAVVWKLRADGTTEPVEVALGITDHAFTEITRVLHGQLADGDAVVTRTVTSTVQIPGAAQRGRR